MSNVVFDFLAVGPFRLPPRFDTVDVRGNEGVVVTRPDTGAWGVYRAEFSVRVPGPGRATGTTKTIADWAEFVRARQGAYDSWLWKAPLIDAFYKVLTTDADGAIGTGDGATTDFALAHKHIDASTLLVYKAGALQTLTTHYTLDDNNDAPVVSFVAAPTGGQAITVAYEFYHPVKFVTDPPTGDWLVATDFVAPVSIEEVFAGAHRV